MPDVAPTNPCPRCRVPLFDGRARTGGALLGCGRCGGVWLDVAASCAVVEGAAEELSSLADVAARHATERVDTAGAGLHCPACAQPLARVALPGTTVELDACPSHGTWFDSGELRIVILAYAKLPQAMHFAPEDYEVLQTEGPSFRDGQGRWVLGADGRWRFRRDPSMNAFMLDDRHAVTADDAERFAEGLVTFVQGVIQGLRRPE
jgi:Zn-finger nucleic acid-binding protein